MSLSTKTFSALLSDAAAAVQGAASTLVDLTVGSVLRAVLEAVAAMGMWLQAMALQIAARTRFSTSSGTDADSWAADYGFSRLAPQAASGSVTFARFTPTGSAVVPVGTVVQTADGSQKFTVIADTNQPAYSASAGGYVLGAGVASVSATVQSQSASSAANVAAGSVTVIGQAIQGVDTVTNPAAFSNGSDAETDTAFRARFVTFINSLSKATRAAIGNAVLSVQQGINYTLTEGFDYSGAAKLGYFYVVVDDGSGSPSSIFLSTVSNAIDAVRPVGSTFGVFAPVVILANVAMTLTTDSGYTHSTVVAQVQAALQTYINSLPIGTTLPFSRLSQIAYSTSPGVTNVTAVALNGGTADITATNQQVVKAGTFSIL